MRDIPNLDFVRSIAVITVVVEHTLLALGIMHVGPYPVAYLGVLGVFVFFVLTSLVLMWSLERKPHTLDFYIRRWFRIYPLALTVIGITILLHAPTGGSPTNFFAYVRPEWDDLVMQLLLLPPCGAYVVSVMWSLPYEVGMYILLPALFFFVRRNFSLWPMLVLWGFVLLCNREMESNSSSFGMAIGYFLPGVMAYIGFARWKPRLPGWLLPVFLLGMWGIFWYDCNFQKGWWFCLIIGLSLPLFRQMRSKYVLVPSRIIAKYSYGIYLTHSFALVIGFYLLRGHSLWVRLGAELVSLLALPVAVYHLLEHPMIQIGSRLAARAEDKYEQRQLKHYRVESILP